MAPIPDNQETPTLDDPLTILLPNDWSYSGTRGISNSMEEHAHLSVAVVKPPADAGTYKIFAVLLADVTQSTVQIMDLLKLDVHLLGV